MKGLTVLIAHYAPPVNTENYRNLLKRTVHSIRSQKVDFDVEIIVCDDGSAWSEPINQRNGITILIGNEIKHNPLLDDLDIDVYLYLPDQDKYLSVVLKDRAFKIAKFRKIVEL